MIVELAIVNAGLDITTPIMKSIDQVLTEHLANCKHRCA